MRRSMKCQCTVHTRPQQWRVFFVRHSTKIFFFPTFLQDNGILLYTGQSQHLAVELFRGRIRVRDSTNMHDQKIRNNRHFSNLGLLRCGQLPGLHHLQLRARGGREVSGHIVNSQIHSTNHLPQIIKKKGSTGSSSWR